MNGQIVGRPPSAEEKAGFAAAANLAPKESLLRIQELAKFVFTNVAVVGTLLTGLGLFTDLGAVLEESWNLPSPFEGVPVAVAALGLSLFCASLAIWPKMSSVDPSRLAEVNAWYERQIKRRGLWMTASLILFSAAILVATFTGTGSADEPEKPSISASWIGLGDEATVSIAAKAEKVPSKWTMVTLVQGRQAGEDGEKGKLVTIFRDRTQPNSAGELAVEGEIGVGERFSTIESSARLLPAETAADPSLQSDLSIRRK